MLNYIVRNRTVFDIETVCKQKTMLIQNWIVWNRTVYMYKMYMELLTYNSWYAMKQNKRKPKQSMCTLFNEKKKHYY